MLPNLTDEASLRENLKQHPDSAAAHSNLAMCLHRLGRLQEAESLLQTAFRLMPDSAPICFNLGIVLAGLGRLTDSELALRRSSSISSADRDSPVHVEANFQLARVLTRQGHWAESEAALRHAISLQPDRAVFHAELGFTLVHSNRLKEAETALRRALSLDSSLSGVHLNLANVLYQFELMEEAEASVRDSLILDPENLPAKVLLSVILLKTGRYQEAWPLFELRRTKSEKWNTDNFEYQSVDPAHIPIVRWRGQSVESKSFLVLQDEGFGDQIQFARFVPMLKSLGVSRVTIGCRAPLHRLLSFVDGVDEVIDPARELQVFQYDLWCHTLSLPLYLGITLSNLPADVPYIKLPKNLLDRWKHAVRKRVASRGMKVGLVWAGSSGLGNVRPGRHISLDEERSVKLDQFVGPLRVPGITFVSLQKGPAEAQLRQLPEELRPVDMMSGVTDFADTAAIIANLDLVVSVDTAVAHLAGALGKPVWIMSRVGGDWRWLLGREDSPWYPSARIFRQKRTGDWTDVVERIEQCLRELVQNPAGLPGVSGATRTS
ncbi:tetratricopeptide repeat protein [Caballeronia temeraria]|uniref:Tetratricopeptide repeat protein n=1 Tax=Caballeronia temeraria TaxID=1777137 RepID=A0A157Z3G9_9BURK|nr:tetratricopeptide repeat-containing glycosyltransferase family protein [Caballeronia temeraria]SAK40064.1 tetratricopeptide repeat protein [Caballeronia temeraria]